MSHNDLTVAAACADLIFGARVRAAAEAAGWQALLISPRDAAASRIRAELPRLVLLDLDARWLDAVALIAALKADPATAAIPVVAFASHVRTDALAAAREAGADQVLARAAFVRRLPELLRVPGT